jgi:hypothetical protein
MINNDEEQPVKMFGEDDRHLSKISRQYDLGNKGFLTETEQQMRSMDFDNVGHLTNSTVSAIVAETLELREETTRMKMWLGILGVAVLVLGLSNLGTAFAAAWLAKDTTVDETTGQLLVKGSDTPVTVQSTGQTFNLVLEEVYSATDKVYGCMYGKDAGKLWNGVLDGTASAITIKEPSKQDADADPTLQNFFVLGITNNRATWNDNMACMPVSDDSGGKVCFDFHDSRCDAHGTDFDHHTRRKLLLGGSGGPGVGNAMAAGGVGNAMAAVSILSTSLRTEEFSPATVVLGSSINYAILTKSGISTVPSSLITGDIGVSPIAATAMTGFSLIADKGGEFSTSAQVVRSNSQHLGRAHAANYGGSTPAILGAAVLDMEKAYTDVAGRNSDIVNYEGGLLGGKTLVPAVYTFKAGDISITSDLYFDAGTRGASAIFIIQTTGNVVVSSGVQMILTNDAKAKNIFWQVAGFVEAGTTAKLEGIFLVKTAVHFRTGSSLNGRILAQTACTLQMATITEPKP